MTSKTFKNWAEIEKYLKKEIDNILGKEVLEVVQDEMIQAVDSVVYDAGTPLYYQRRGLSEYSLGLGGRQQMDGVVNNGTLEVTNNAPPQNEFNNDKSLAYNIEYGYGSKDQWFNVSRPFIQTTKENLKRNKNHVEAMKEGLVKRGLKVVD